MKYMHTFSFFLLFTGIVIPGFSQLIDSTDTVAIGEVIVRKDSRIDILGKKMAEYNEALSKNIRSGKGYRLMLLSTNDRNLAMQLRSRLLQQYPDQKVYMTYQSPYIKLKFGNFTEKEEAERFRKHLMNQYIVSGNIYIIPEMIEIKPEKNPEGE
ncbi:MAG TPA: SPOR domain-containing protein [Ferruginibacter sp.]|nr:SPOR domain-containing protein [Ferruginibacter sp.]